MGQGTYMMCCCVFEWVVVVKSRRERGVGEVEGATTTRETTRRHRHRRGGGRVRLSADRKLIDRIREELMYDQQNDRGGDGTAKARSSDTLRAAKLLQSGTIRAVLFTTALTQQNEEH